jgi:hypothetical protein
MAAVRRESQYQARAIGLAPIILARAQRGSSQNLLLADQPLLGWYATRIACACARHRLDGRRGARLVTWKLHGDRGHNAELLLIMLTTGWPVSSRMPASLVWQRRRNWHLQTFGMLPVTLAPPLSLQSSLSGYGLLLRCL